MLFLCCSVETVGRGCAVVLFLCLCLTHNMFDVLCSSSDMEFVQNFTPPDFQAKNFSPSFSPNFNSFSKKKTQKMIENGEIYTAGKNFTLLPAVTNRIIMITDHYDV